MRLKRQPLPLSEVLSVAAQVAEGLVEAHSRGIIHRDIKPANIMLTARHQAKVMDFGLAKMIEQESIVESQAETQSLLTESGMIVGTVPYMSPEQVKSETLDARSDIFSFGTVLYEMVSGRCPFAAESAAATFSAILTREPPPRARYAPEAPIELQRIVSKALAKDREERFQTIKDLQFDLRTLKQELEFPKQGRSLQPAANSSAAATSGGSQAREETAHEQAAITAEAAGAHTTSSAEYLFGEIKRHKRGTFLALAVVVMVAAALVYFAWGGKPIDSVAVLPFVNASADPNMEYLSDGIPESISNSLSQLPNLKVMSRNSVFSFKGPELNAQEVGQKLGVRAVLTGRVTQRGDGLAISIELVDVRDNSQIWGQQYNRKLADVFAVQEEIAREISEKLLLKVSGAEWQQLAKRPTENIKAFQYYMQGRAYAQRRTREDLLEAIRYYENWIAKIYAALNEKEPALTWLEHGLAAGAIGLFL